MINRVVLIGRLVRDPELKKTVSGTSVVNFTIAIDNIVKPGAEKSTSFIPCVVWNKTADYVVKYIHKGQLCGVEGRLTQRSYQSKDNRTVQVFEVICDSVNSLERKTEREDYISENNITTKNTESLDTFDDDDLPF